MPPPRRRSNLLVELSDPRFAQRPMHHGLEALDAVGVRTWREHRTPERILAWIDDAFGGTASIDAAAGGIWVAEDASGPIAFAAFDVRGLPYRWLRNWRNEESTSVMGPLGVVERARGRGIGRTLVHAAMYAMLERGYRRALVPAVDPDLVPFFERAADAWFVESVEARPERLFRTTVLASGNGSNFAAVADAAARGELPLRIERLVVNKPGAFARERARLVGVPSEVVAWRRAEESRDAYDERVIAAVAATQAELMLFLGWMHVLPATFVARFPEALNVHPAFLPLDPQSDRVTMPDGTSIDVYRGAHAFDEALRAGSPWAGASVHRVGASVDRGELFARLPLRLDGDSRDVLDERLHALERRVVATAIRAWAARRD